MNHLRLGPEQRRDLGAVLAGEQLGELLLLGGLDVRRHDFHREVEVAPRILSPGIVLIEPDIAVLEQFRVLAGDVARRARVVARAVAHGAEQVFRLLHQFFEDPRRAADRHQGENLDLLGDARHRRAGSRRDVADDQVDAVLLHLVAQLGDLLGAAAGLVVDQRLDLATGKPHAVIGRRKLAVVDPADDQLDALFRRDAESRRAGAGKECGNPHLDGLRGRGAGNECRARHARKQDRNTPLCKLHKNLPHVH